MNVLAFLIPISIGLGVIGLVAFLWALKAGQYDDLNGAAERILYDEEESSDIQDEEKNGA